MQHVFPEFAFIIESYYFFGDTVIVLHRNVNITVVMRASCSQLLVDKLNVSVLRHFLNEMSLVEGGVEII